MPYFFSDDTICAIATPIGEGGIGIIKISGAEALASVHTIFRTRPHGKALRSHRLHYGWIIDPATQQPVDEVLVSYMASPDTYTREDVVEINCHSGYAVLQRILALVVAAGARLAEPGEFTRRAFLHGRIDLTQAEAVAEVIRSRSEHSLALANQHLQGAFRLQIQAWLEELIAVQSHLEAAIDFADEASGNALLENASLASRLEQQLLQPLAGVLARYACGRVLRDGLSLVLVGKPNVGKSSLLNALLGKDRAIVTAIPGTTRDVIEDSFLLAGVEVRILDTAGIRHDPDEIEALGIERTRRALATTDAALWLVDQSGPLTAEDDSVLQTIAAKRHLILLNKADLPQVTGIDTVLARYGSAAPILNMCVFNREDLDRLKNHLNEAFLRQPLASVRGALIPNQRQHDALHQAHDALTRARQLLAAEDFPELVSLELRAAIRQLAIILGQETEDALLDEIFSRFCVGK